MIEYPRNNQESSDGIKPGQGKQNTGGWDNDIFKIKTIKKEKN